MATHATHVGTRNISATRGDGGREDAVEVELEHARWRHFAWAMVGLGLGLLLLLRLEGGLKVLGIPILLGGLSAARSFVRTLLHAPGAIAVRASEVVLTPRLCSGRELKLAIADVRHAYLLRRTVPWTTAGPVLVVETARGAFEYPRDWFASDGDQRRVASALNRQLGQK